MSVIRPKPPEDPLHHDAGGLEAAAGLPAGGLGPWCEPLAPYRDAVLASPGPGLPDRLLADYTTAATATGGTGRATSELFAILRTARRLREGVDRVIVAGRGAAAARAICDACCHPCHNELSRGERGGRPRLSFAPPLVDNDSLQALLDLVEPAGAPRTSDLLDQWGVVAVDDGARHAADGMATDAAGDADAVVRVLVSALAAGRAAAAPLAERFAAVAAPDGAMAGLCAASGCPPEFAVPEGVAGFAAFCGVGLLPAAIAGVDVVQLLAGGRAMRRRFAEAPAPENPVLRFVAAARLAEERLATTAGGLAAWTPQLAATCGWYDTVRPRPSRKAATFRTAVLAAAPRRDAVPVPTSPSPGPRGETDAADRRSPGGTPWPEWHARGVAAARAAEAPLAAIFLPRIDEHATGQLLMLLLLAAAVAEEAARPAAGAGRRPRV